jgi:hypothetical protein
MTNTNSKPSDETIIGYVLRATRGMTAEDVAVALGMGTDEETVEAVEDVLVAAIEARKLRGSRVFGLTHFGTTASLGIEPRDGWP